MSSGFFSFFKKKATEQPSQQEIVERQDMIEGVVKLDEKIVREIMVPRIDVQFISVTSTYDEVISIISEQGFSRYPVYDQNIDNIIGILYAKDLLKEGIRESFDIRSIMRKPYFVPDTKHLDDLLREFKLQKVHIAIVIDEYGGVSGIVAMEDIIEVIVGEIQDEFDGDLEDEIEETGESTYTCDGRASIEDINETLGLSLPEADYETLGGYVFELFGRIPEQGETIEDESCIYLIQEMEGHKINTIKVTKKPV